MKNKTAIVTGASSGLGKSLVEELVKKDIRVFALSRDMSKVSFPDSVMKIDCDVSKSEDIKNAFLEIDKQTNSIDYLVNCAGRGLVKTFAQTNSQEINEVIKVNLTGNIQFALEAYQRMIPKKSGYIINVGSTSSIKARELETIYCASKWGIRGFTESLRLEAKAHGIKVTGFYPGGMASENFWQIAPGKDISNFMPTEKIAQQIVSILESANEIAVAEIVIERP